MTVNLFIKVVEIEEVNLALESRSQDLEYQAALHQQIASLETLEHNPIRLYTLDESKSYGTIESRDRYHITCRMGSYYIIQ